MSLNPNKLSLPREGAAPAGRAERMALPAKHFVTGEPLDVVVEGAQIALFGMGC
jgi:peptide-methionine (S)-S-oxide reductase